MEWNPTFAASEVGEMGLKTEANWGEANPGALQADVCSWTLRTSVQALVADISLLPAGRAENTSLGGQGRESGFPFYAQT